MQTQPKHTKLKHVDINIQPLIKAFEKANTLSSFIHWEPTWSEKKEKWLKVPIQRINQPDSHFTLNEALTHTNKTLGLVFSLDHPFIALDIDGVNPDTTPSLKKFIENHPTYIEASPSGLPNRVRLVYQLGSIKDKALLKPKTKIVPQDQISSTKSEIELFNCSLNYTTLTGQELPESTHSISHISISDITEHFPTFKAKSQVIPINDDVKSQMEAANNRTASLIPAKTWVNTVPLHRDESKLTQVLDRHGITYYEFWLQGIMCIHAAWGTITGFQYADEWSQQALDDYDQEELKEKWDSFDNAKEQRVTKATYQWIFSQFSIDWPVTMSAKSKTPNVLEIDNFLAFLKHQGLTIDRDAISLTYFLSGQADSDIYPHYYRDKTQAFSIPGVDITRLARRIQTVASNYNYRPQHKKIEEFIMSIISDKFPEDYTNRFAKEIASRPHYDPDTEPDYLQLMARSIIQRNPNYKHPTQEFHDVLIRKWLLSLGRTFWPNELSVPSHRHTTAEGMLILSDKSVSGGINKSSLGMRLFPHDWRHLYTQTSPGRASKDNLKEYFFETVKSCLIDWDEVDSVIGAAISAPILKSLITSKADIARTPYDREPTTYMRRYSIMSSTNRADLSLPNEGLRRFWWLNVSYVDTYKLDTWEMYNLWRQIRYELSHYDTSQVNAPWTLTTKEKKYLESYLSKHKATTSLEEYLLGHYDWTEQGFIDQKELYMAKNEKGQLKTNSNNTLGKIATQGLNEIYNSVPFKTTIKQMKHTLGRMMTEFAPDEIYLGRTLISKGKYDFRGQVRYLMPTERNDTLMRESTVLD